MPDERQTQHARDIAFTRTLSRVTGVPFNQVRQATRQSTTTVGQSRQPLNAPAPISQTSPELFGPSSVPRSFSPRPFISPQEPGGATANPGVAGIPLNNDVWFNADDEKFYYINILTDGRFEEI